MKKCLVVLLALAVAGGASAQLKATVTAELNPELLRFSSPIADSADIASASIDFLSSSGNGTIGRENGLKLALNYTGEGFSGYLRLNADRLIRAHGNSAAAHSFVNGSGNNVTPNDLLSLAFDEWNAKATVGMFNLFVGNTGDRGKVKTLQNFDGYLKTKIDNYGINAYAAGSGFKDLDNNNLQRTFTFAPVTSTTTPPVTTNYFTNANNPYFSAAVKFDPFTVQIAGDLGYNNEIGSDALSQTRLNGAFRVSGEKVADLVTFDVIYKFHGGDADTFDGTGSTQPDGSGVSSHSFGVYANLFVVNGLDIGLGYSGLFRSYEDADMGTLGTFTRSGPFYSGIDLRFAYTGIDKLTITFNNNVSFAGVEDDDDIKTAVSGVDGMPLTTTIPTAFKSAKDSWFALYNALGVNYKLSDKLTASIQFANRLGTRTTEVEITTPVALSVKQEMTNDRFGAAAFASYAFSSNVTIAAGLDFLYSSTSTKAGTPGTPDTNTGSMTLGIPLYLKIVY
jgi:hypothetical protein